MIDAGRRQLSAAWRLAARALDTRRRHFLTFGAGVAGATFAAPVLTRPVLVAARRGVAPRETPGYRETQHVRRYYATTQL